jgi:ferredoxin
LHHSPNKIIIQTVNVTQTSTARLAAPTLKVTRTAQLSSAHKPHPQKRHHQNQHLFSKPSAMDATYTITWSSKGSEDVPKTIRCADDEYLIHGAEAAGFEWPCSGRSGTDSTSTARLVEGTVDQHDQAFPTDEQVRKGYSLTDVAHPRSDCVVVVVVVVVAVEGELR